MSAKTPTPTYSPEIWSMGISVRISETVFCHYNEKIWRLQWARKHVSCHFFDVSSPRTSDHIDPTITQLVDFIFCHTYPEIGFK
jgi:hypothetical protein